MVIFQKSRDHDPKPLLVWEPLTGPTDHTGLASLWQGNFSEITDKTSPAEALYGFVPLRSPHSLCGKDKTITVSYFWHHLSDFKNDYSSEWFDNRIMVAIQKAGSVSWAFLCPAGTTERLCL